jgi:2-oxoglutarate ferredoxin oxidoreductase subunit alpha
VDRLLEKIHNAAAFVPAPVIRSRPDATIGLITLGGCDGAVREALETLEADGSRFDYMRIRAFPFSDDVVSFLEAHELNIVIEQNRDAQLLSLLTLETPIGKDRLASVRQYGGLPMSAHHVVTGVRDQLGMAQAEGAMA